MFTRSTILDFTGKKLALSFIAHELVDGQRPPYVHLASTRRHSRDRFSQAFPVFRALPLPCIILNKNRRTKNGGGLGTRLASAPARVPGPRVPGPWVPGPVFIVTCGVCMDINFVS